MTSDLGNKAEVGSTQRSGLALVWVAQDKNKLAIYLTRYTSGRGQFHDSTLPQIP